MSHSQVTYFDWHVEKVIVANVRENKIWRIVRHNPNKEGHIFFVNKSAVVLAIKSAKPRLRLRLS